MKQPQTAQPLQSGQIWQIQDSNLHIEIVGKHLVHYKLYKGQTKRAPISLSAKVVLEKYLKKSKAVLVQAGLDPTRSVVQRPRSTA